MSAQSDGRALQSGFGSRTRRNVFWEKSKRVKRSLGNGPLSGLDRSTFTPTPPANAIADVNARLSATDTLPMRAQQRRIIDIRNLLWERVIAATSNLRNDRNK